MISPKILIILTISLLFILDPLAHSSKLLNVVSHPSHPHLKVADNHNSDDSSSNIDLRHSKASSWKTKKSTESLRHCDTELIFNKLKSAFRAKLDRASSFSGRSMGDGADGSVKNGNKETNSTKKEKSGSFAGLGISKEVIKGLYHAGYKLPTPVQRRVIPPVMQGHDVVAMARTGSGKTAAFLVPAICRVVDLTAIGREKGRVLGLQCLVLEPTRELALQTFLFCKKYAKFTPLTATVVTGGESLEAQFAALAANPEVLVATPGRLIQVREPRTRTHPHLRC